MTFNLKKHRKKQNNSKQKLHNPDGTHHAVSKSFDSFARSNSITKTKNKTIQESKFEVETEVDGEIFRTSCPAFINPKTNKLYIAEDECKTEKVNTLNIVNDTEMDEEDNIED